MSIDSRSIPPGGRTASLLLLAAVLLAHSVHVVADHRSLRPQRRQTLAYSLEQLQASSGSQLAAVLALAAEPGPQLDVQIAANLSLDAAPSLLRRRFARSVTLRGAGPPEWTEINLDESYDAWQLLPGVTLALENLTLSNLPERGSADGGAPANVSGRVNGLQGFAAVLGGQLQGLLVAAAAGRRFCTL